MERQIETTSQTHAKIVMVGPSGCGKTEVGKALAESIHAEFLDADDFHTPENKERMRSGKGLTDELRRPWLANIRKAAEATSQHSVVVLACSGLKTDLRHQLSHGDPTWRFVSLEVDAKTLRDRVTTRKGHFFPATLLDDQLKTWQPLSPDEGFAVDGTKPIEDIVHEIQERLEPSMLSNVVEHLAT